MAVSHLDAFYRHLTRTKMFSKGWGDPDIIKQLLEIRKEICNKNRGVKFEDHCQVTITKESSGNDFIVYEGNFETPLRKHYPEVINDEIKQAYFQMILPKNWKYSDNSHKPICIHLAGTGDHYFWRRRNLMVKPLLKQNIGSIILENPYYGLRKPKNQFYSGLLHVSDVFVMGACLILESSVLLKMCEKNGFGPLGVTGLSMGGHMASLVATYWPKSLVLVPCLSWSTGSAVFTEGLMSNAVKWDVLQKQYFSNEKYHKILSKVIRIVDDPAQSGLVRFIPNFVNFQSKCNGTNVTPYELLESATSTELNSYLPNTFNNSPFKKLKLISKIKKDQFIYKPRGRHAIWFMRGLMDEFTHLKNFPMPIDNSLIIAICAQKDGYVPRDGCMNLLELWPGCSVRYINGGHVNAFIRYLDVFRKSIVEAFERKRRKEQQETVKSAVS